jgi:hypothetical protein
VKRAGEYDVHGASAVFFEHASLEAILKTCRKRSGSSLSLIIVETRMVVGVLWDGELVRG